MVYVIQVCWQLASSSVLILLAKCQQTSMTYTIAVFTVKNSWWWTDELSETCRVLLYEFSPRYSRFDTSSYQTSLRNVVQNHGHVRIVLGINPKEITVKVPLVVTSHAYWKWKYINVWHMWGWIDCYKTTARLKLANSLILCFWTSFLIMSINPSKTLHDIYKEDFPLLSLHVFQGMVRSGK
jgi:hypothetical protein